MIELWLVRIVSCEDATARIVGWKPGTYLKYRGGLSAVPLEDASIFTYREAAEDAIKKHVMYGLKMETVRMVQGRQAEH